VTYELTILVYSVLLTFVLIMIPATQAVFQNGLKVMTGPRDNLPEPTVFVARARRLSTNMLENMVLFIPLVLIAHVAGISNEMTVLGTQLFLGARAVHAIIYLAGIPWIRPVAWFVAVLGMALIVLELL
jgi:uncharacterized MAPEG superfamily protein